ncbi:hypothetical protein A0U92_01100 [Acetobacter aceti]|uniref:Lipoprotein n=1 Tax=Acetobacter aceti TaxID=435 RepID=A0A1U9KCP6_ACEAC|nr:hypothetical protein [Acetobacter aceti]AQS83595.1 hypothetical protein A0U92_01100 [Acetobacter aceti]
MKIIRTATALAILTTLTACGDNAPGKDEVRDFMANQSISEVYSVNPFQKHSEQERDNAIDKIKKALDIQSLDCSATKGFKNVWDCTVNVMVMNEPHTSKYRFHRDDKGKLQGEVISE